MPGMSGLLEVIALLPADAERAEAGGADRIELCGTLDEGGMSPTPQLVDQVRRATSIQLRVMVRLRPGFGTDGGEAIRLRGLMASYADAGADGMVLGFLNGLGEVDAGVVGELVGERNGLNGMTCTRESTELPRSARLGAWNDVP